MSDHSCPVVRVKLEPHGNADSLSVVKVEGFQVCVRTEDWTDGDLAVYIPPDSIVPDIEAFKFLGGHRRIKCKKLRGVWSQGMLVAVEACIPDGFRETIYEGKDMAPLGNIMPYVAPEPGIPGVPGAPAIGSINGPSVFTTKYDVESYYRAPNLFNSGEPCIATEKIHGTNARFVWCTKKEQFFAGSRTNWWEENESNTWWRCVRENPWIFDWCQQHSDCILYGEIYGVQDLKYGLVPGEIDFRVFDIFEETRFWDWAAFKAVLDYHQRTPVLYEGAFNAREFKTLADGRSVVEGADHIREGIVVRPFVERQHSRHGRVCVKFVSNEYLAKQK